MHGFLFVCFTTLRCVSVSDICVTMPAVGSACNISTRFSLNITEAKAMQNNNILSIISLLFRVAVHLSLSGASFNVSHKCFNDKQQ